MPQLQDVVRVKIVTSGSEFVQHELNTGAWKAGDALEYMRAMNARLPLLPIPECKEV
jgi:hypothetical protein|tara:strand:+ start:1821 stop:1991 length:171 start_codon:yes stop_codon:yes gene_type:complete